MVSVNKKKKLANAYAVPPTLKEKDFRIKRSLFYTPSQRMIDKERLNKQLEEYYDNKEE